jgi:hypothetical protein
MAAIPSPPAVSGQELGSEGTTRVPRLMTFDGTTSSKEAVVSAMRSGPPLQREPSDNANNARERG